MLFCFSLEESLKKAHAAPLFKVMLTTPFTFPLLFFISPLAFTSSLHFLLFSPCFFPFFPLVSSPFLHTSPSHFSSLLLLKPLSSSHFLPLPSHNHSSLRIFSPLVFSSSFSSFALPHLFSPFQLAFRFFTHCAFFCLYFFSFPHSFNHTLFLPSFLLSPLLPLLHFSLSLSSGLRCPPALTCGVIECHRGLHVTETYMY